MMILFSSSIGPIAVDCILHEGHDSQLGITEIPIEDGSKITDHAYLEPKRVRLEFAAYSAAATFQTLVRFQESRIPFVAVTGLNIYKDMLIRRLTAERDERTARILRGRADLQEAIIVQTAYAASESGSENGAKTPTKGTSGDSATANRAAGSNMRGDAATTSVPANSSLLNSVFGR